MSARVRDRLTPLEQDTGRVRLWGCPACAPPESGRSRTGARPERSCAAPGQVENGWIAKGKTPLLAS